MGQGLLTITNVVNETPGPPNEWRLTVTNSAGVTVGDHLIGQLAGGDDAVWLITQVPSGTEVIVQDSLTEGNGSVEFGQPDTGSVGYSTPTPNFNLTTGPEGARGWRAVCERNWAVIDAAL